MRVLHHYHARQTYKSGVHCFLHKKLPVLIDVM